MSLISQIESILFVASKPLTFAQIAKALGVSEQKVAEAANEIVKRFNHDESGIHILHEGTQMQMATNPVNVDAMSAFIKDEVSGELTKAQLETLTVVAYRGPITRPELEQIRGVNCAIILRTLLMRGLIEEDEDREKMLQTYQVSMDALRHLGISSTRELPEYESLHAHDHIQEALREEI